MTLTYQPVNPSYWGVLYARTLPEMVEWAKSDGMIFVEREPIIFCEFRVATTDGSELTENALSRLRESAVAVRNSARTRLEDPYLGAATGLMHALSAREPRFGERERLEDLMEKRREFLRMNKHITNPYQETE